MKRQPGQRVNGGFTLLELLVVVVIAGIVLSMVVFTATPNPATVLDQEARRIARLLALAQDEAQLRARSIAVDIDLQGWRFAVMEGRDLRPLTEDPFRPARWTNPLDAIDVISDHPAARPQAGTWRIVLSREPIDQPLRITLRRGEARMQLLLDGRGRFEVERASRADDVTLPSRLAGIPTIAVLADGS